MSNVRGKFKVARIEQTEMMRKKDDQSDAGKDVYETVEMRTIVMNPVYANNDPEHENYRFWRMSPSGEIKLGTVNPEAWKHFELGGEYYVDFTKAE